MTDISDEDIRARAHAIWQQEGEPEGRADEHWAQAEQELAEAVKTPGLDPTAGSDTDATAPLVAAATKAGKPTD